MGNPSPKRIRSDPDEAVPNTQTCVLQSGIDPGFLCLGRSARTGLGRTGGGAQQRPARRPRRGRCRPPWWRISPQSGSRRRSSGSSSAANRQRSTASPCTSAASPAKRARASGPNRAAARAWWRPSAAEFPIERSATQLAVHPRLATGPFAKAAATSAEALILDLEDAVAEDQKIAARARGGEQRRS